MCSYIVQPISKEPVLFGESPLWDGRRNALIFTNCFGRSVSIFDPVSGETKSTVVRDEDSSKFLSFCIPYSSCTNKFLVADSNTGKLVEFDWEEEKVTKTLFNLNNSALNWEDGKCDSRGRLWTGTACFEDIGELKLAPGSGTIYKFTVNRDNLIHVPQKTTASFDIPNGLGWNKEGTKLFWNDLTKRAVKVFDFDENLGKLGNHKTLFDFNDHPDQLKTNYMPDGLCVDLSGNIWVACWQGSCVIKIDGETGQLLDKIDLPVSNVTSVAFGGASFQDIYVTTTSIQLDGSPVLGEPDAGKLFKLRNEKDNSGRGFQEHFLDL